MTDCKSMFDDVCRRGSIPDNARPLLDLEIARDRMRDDGAEVRRVAARRQLALAPAEGRAEAPLYLRRVLGARRVHQIERPDLDEIPRGEELEARGAAKSEEAARGQGRRRGRAAVATASAKIIARER